MASCCSDTMTKSSCCSKPTIKSTSTRWKLDDYVGAVACRVSNRYRSGYRVVPGLYQLGSPNSESPVFVTGNYKLTFNLVRRNIGKLDAWILVLDTAGINVWCAAGKGSFGTSELVKRIQSENLSERVTHRKVIVPQLGAPGVAAHEVKKQTGFSVVYGPVNSNDIPDFIALNLTATPKMRTVTFSLRERAMLIPIEVISLCKKSWLPLLMVAVAMGLQLDGIIFAKMAELTLPFALSLGASILIGCALHPLVMPLLPMRSFALQGAFLGALGGAGLHFLAGLNSGSLFGNIAIALLVTALSSYGAYNFTGSTPIANKSGVKKELRIAIPAYIAAASAIFVLLVLHKIQYEGII